MITSDMDFANEELNAFSSAFKYFNAFACYEDMCVMYMSPQWRSIILVCIKITYYNSMRPRSIIYL